MTPEERQRRRDATQRIAREQHRVAYAGAIALVVIGLGLFAGGTAVMVLNDTLPIWTLICMEVSGVTSFLLGLKKLRDLRAG